MARSRTEIFEEASRKRGPPEPTDGLDAAKRQKLDAQVTKPKLYIPPFAPGPHTIAELFTITTDAALQTFDVSQLSDDLAVKIVVTILQRIDVDTLNQAVTVSNVLSNRQCLTNLRPRESSNALTSWKLLHQFQFQKTLS